MPKIAILPPELASQIAAGEVVERPASVVKELIENAIDAGATRCDVEISGGGIERVLVRDDGVGMSAEDVVLSVERHATSKLHSLGELEEVATLGFRGEALPSIASVSRFTLRSRRAEDESGVELRVVGGTDGSPTPTGMPVGTSVEVSDLFFNVPARRKFLRSSGTESGHVTDVLEAAALAMPTLTFTLIRDGRKSREWLRASGREERVRGVLDGETLRGCRGERGPLRVEAHLGGPERSRNGAGGLRLLVNGRPVRDRALFATVAQAYGGVLERGRYPVGVVYLDLPARLVDVNAHPQKAEVRFADPRAVSDALYAVLQKELAREYSLPTGARNPWTTPHVASALRSRAEGPGAATRSTGGASAVSRGAGERVAPPPGAPLFLRDVEPTLDAFEALGQDTIDAHAGFSSRGTPEEPPWAKLRFLAQVRQTYLLCEGPLGLYVVDQHAASERLSFGRLRSEYASTKVPSQALLFPVTIETSAEQAALVERHQTEFHRVGLEAERRGETRVSVHSVPRLLERASPERLLFDLLNEVAEKGRGFEEAVDAALARMACHGSLRAGDPLTRPEAEALLAGLGATSFDGRCPHGRPVVAVTTWSELERRVGRR